MRDVQSKQVRQILMNELGLTREIVREEMKAIMTAEIEKKIHSILGSGHIQALVKAEVDKQFRAHGGVSVAKAVTEEAQRQIAEVVKERLVFSIREVGEFS